MLSDLLDESLVQLNVEASDWEDAIRKATAPLVANGKVTEGYVDDINADGCDLVTPRADHPDIPSGAFVNDAVNRPLPAQGGGIDR